MHEFKAYFYSLLLNQFNTIIIQAIILAVFALIFDKKIQ